MVEAAVVSARLCQFRAGDLTLTAKRWGREGAKPVLALHGWLDNCASFDFLAPLLDDCDVVCLDSSGHGQSDHRNHLGAYNIWQDIAEIFAVADQLGWQEFALVGHSRGAMVAFLAAGTFPSRIQSLVMIEGACPWLAEADVTAENLAESIGHVRSWLQRPKSVYPDFASAVAVREAGMFPIAHADAAALAAHGVAPVDGGFSWRYDRKLMAGSELRLSAAQVESFYQRVTASCLLLQASEGLLKQDKALTQWLQAREQWSIVDLPGSHHLHMSEQCQSVAQHINQHLGSL